MNYILENSADIDPSIIKLMIGIVSTYFIIFLAVIAFNIICRWKVLKKAGKEGWEAIIPIYTNIVFLQITNNPIWLLALLLVPGVNAVGAVLYNVFVSINLSKAFNKNTAFALLLIFIPLVGYPILAFGKDQYHKPDAIL